LTISRKHVYRNAGRSYFNCVKGITLLIAIFIATGCNNKEKLIDHEELAFKRILKRVQNGGSPAGQDTQILASLYYHGYGVRADKKEAARLFNLGPGVGGDGEYVENCGMGNFALGVMHLKGDGVLQDYQEALKRFQSSYGTGGAFRNGEPEFNVAWMYAQGKGVQQDFITAYAWYSISAATGNTLAQRARDKIIELIPPDDVLKAQALSRKLKMDRELTPLTFAELPDIAEEQLKWGTIFNEEDGFFEFGLPLYSW
jgi:hypothetical protein